MINIGYIALLTQLGINKCKCAENINITSRSMKSNIWKEFIHRIKLIQYNNQKQTNLKYHQISFLNFLLLSDYVTGKRLLLVGFIYFHPITEDLGMRESTWRGRGQMFSLSGQYPQPSRRIPLVPFTLDSPKQVTRQSLRPNQVVSQAREQKERKLLSLPSRTQSSVGKAVK